MKLSLRYGAFALAALAVVFGVEYMRTGSRGGAASSGAGRRPVSLSAPVVAVGLVEKVADTETHRYTGQVVPVSAVDLTARVAAEIVDVAFAEGGRVAEGDVLFRLDPVRYRAAVERGAAAVAECRAKVAYAKLTYERSLELFGRKATPKDAVDSAKSDYDAAEAALRAAEADLITARDDLDNTRVVAPIGGKIGIAAYTRGNYVTPSSGVLATIVDTDTLRVRFSLSTREYLALFRNEKALKDNAAVLLRLSDDSAYDLPGTVELVDNRADGRSDTVTVYARFANPEGILIPDAAVTVLLSRVGGGEAPAIAPSAVMYDADSAYVYVVDAAGRVERRNVELGVSTGSAQIVRSGLEVGESVIVDGMHKTSPGGAVESKRRDWLPAPGNGR